MYVEELERGEKEKLIKILDSIARSEAKSEWEISKITGISRSWINELLRKTKDNDLFFALKGKRDANVYEITLKGLMFLVKNSFTRDYIPLMFEKWGVKEVLKQWFMIGFGYDLTEEEEKEVSRKVEELEIPKDFEECIKDSSIKVLEGLSDVGMHRSDYEFWLTFFQKFSTLLTQNHSKMLGKIFEEEGKRNLLFARDLQAGLPKFHLASQYHKLKELVVDLQKEQQPFVEGYLGISRVHAFLCELRIDRYKRVIDKMKNLEEEKELYEDLPEVLDILGKRLAPNRKPRGEELKFLNHWFERRDKLLASKEVYEKVEDLKARLNEVTKGA